MDHGLSAPLAENFCAVAPRLSEELVGPGARAQVAALCKCIAVEAEAGLEVRLAEGQHGVDFGWCAHSPRRPETWRAVVAANTDAIAGAPRWTRLVRHLENLDWREAVQSMWFEFDLGPDVAELPVPGIFVRYAAGHDEAWRAMAREAAEIPSAVVEAMAAQLAILQWHGVVSYFGFLLSRPVEAMRVVLAATPEQMRAALEELGWRGCRAALTALTADLEELGARLVWQVDLGRAVDKVSVEIFMNGSHRERVEKARQLLEAWIPQGLCGESKAEALLAWEGAVRERQAGPLWPVHLRDDAAADGSFSFLACTLNHFKLSLAADGVREAKAYLSFREERHDPRGTAREGAYAPRG